MDIITPIKWSILCPIYKLKLLNARNFMMQVRRPKGVSGEREAQASAAACIYNFVIVVTVFELH